jgi:hypothetical protein
VAEDEKALITAFVEGHEKEGIGLLLDPAQLRPAVASDPSLHIVRDVYFRAIFAPGHIRNRDAPAALREKPLQELAATLALFPGPGQGRVVADVLEDAPGRNLEFQARRSTLSEGICHIFILEVERITSKPALLADLLLQVASDETCVLRLDR